MTNKLLLLLTGSLILSTQLAAQRYEVTWESLDKHPTPRWFTEAKFGLFVHWGVYSVPAYRNLTDTRQGNYAEWYAPDVMYKPWRNNKFHERNYGRDFSYRDFAPMFRAELWDPLEWATIFQNSGARYVVLTAKHHDGYCLWPTEDPNTAFWNSMQTGPRRDLIGELAREVRMKGLKLGLYYSLMEWETTRTNWPHDPQYASERNGLYVPKEIWEQYHLEDSVYLEHIQFQLKELVMNYSPDLIYADGAWDYPDSIWQSREFISWFYNNAANSRSVLVNDRWGSNTQGAHGDYFTSEYNNVSYTGDLAWEECRAMSYSFGYNRAEQLEDFESAEALVELLCRTVCQGGNLLLNVSPRADGKIPLLQQERLTEIGRWLDINGEAIYNTSPAFFESNSNTYTKQRNTINIFQYGWSQGAIKLDISADIKVKNCILLGYDNKIVWKQQGPDLRIIPPVISPDDDKIKYVYVFQIEVEPEIN